MDKGILTKDNIFARYENNRIVYYRIDSSIGADLWDNHWGDNISINLNEYYRAYLKGYLGRGQLRHVFLKHLPKHGLILEGGCGMGQYVVALRARGYNCIGLDFAAKTVKRVKSVLPDLPIKVGNVCDLSLGNESIDAYISLGVMEHFEDGPSRALKEAQRVLKRNGLLLVSVPQAFHWRKAASSPENTMLPENALFYQYAFTSWEFRTILINSGFQVIAEYGYGSHFAFRIRFEKFRSLLKRFPRLAYLDLLMDRTPIGRNLARMRLFVARKKKSI